MRAGFVTCVQLGLECMEEIYACGGTLDLVVTLLDEQSRGKSGRVYVDGFCAERGIPLLRTRSINDPRAIETLRDMRLDWLFIIGWSQIASEEVLGSVSRGVLGIHPTLLPQGRGRASIPWAILKGLPETGITLFQLDQGVDTGPIVLQEAIPIEPDETATTLYAKVCRAHRTLLRRVWPSLVTDAVSLRSQDETNASVWPGRKPSDGEITAEMDLADVDRLVRAVSHPYPGAFMVLNGEILRIWRGRVGDPTQDPPPGAIRIQRWDGIYDALDYDRVDAHGAR